MTMVFNHNNPAMAIGNHGSSPGQFNHPVAVAVNLRGEIAIADGKLNRVQIFSGSGELEHGFGRPGSARGEFKGISDLKFTPRGHVAIVDSGNHRIQVVSATGNVVQVIGRYGWKIGQFINPCALTVNGKGEYFVCDEGNKRIQRLSDRGRPLLEWGSHRGPTPEPETITITATNDELRPVIYSVFGAPCDVVVGLHGEIIVCDAGRRELLVFSDAGVCLHVVSAPHIFENNSPAAIAICSSMLATIATTLPEENLKADLRRDVQAVCILAVFPPDKRVRVGRFEPIPVHCAVQIVSCITYYDALHLRLVNRYFHQICRRLRNQWNLFPLTQGNATIMKYNRVVAPATGLIAVEEAFQKWGLRIYKPSNRIRKHVMDFQGGFCSALSMLYGPMFCYQYEDVLLALFRFYACPHSEEIDKAAFIEIVTQIEEVCSNLRTWEQCTPFSRCTANAVLLPTIKPAESESLTTRGVSLPTSLQHVENAQQHQLDKLLQKLKTL
ncbi:wech protein [Phytophthora nicotianae]|uniref:Wech protein n=1 Tax=Phytophthora nicotianae TaxID=4792 RepID=A0A0W8CBC4_PHYNI|nr:wech protein [Phytophthora nicotianae]